MRNRRLVQTASVALLVGMPLVGIFRVDVAARRVIFFWQELPLIWLAAILPTLLILPLGGFFLLAQKHGRLFCSWACPQGAINEYAAKSHLRLWGRRHLRATRRERRYPESARRSRLRWLVKGSRRWAEVAAYLGRAIFLPPLMAFAAISYVMAPERLWALLTGGVWTHPAVLAFVGASGILYADLILLQEKACRVCFFGYLQSIAGYGQRTGVRRNPERKSLCHGCSACRDSCFAGVDPRSRAWEWEWVRSNDLTFDQCVSCGDCLVACDDVTSRRGVPLIMEMPPVVKAEVARGP